MRIYTNFKEAVNEIRRDLAEMGITVKPKSYQNVNVEGNDAFTTKELQNYIYCVVSPIGHDLNPTLPWADKEFEERIATEPVNPGEAYKLRMDVWEEFLDQYGEFDYSYPERLCHYTKNNQIEEAIRVLTNDPDSRQCFISVWDTDIYQAGGKVRIPCTLGYQLQIREGKLNLTYLQRSSDFATHFQNDVYLAYNLQRYIANKLHVPVGIYTHWIGSLHIFQKDVAGVF